MVYAARTMPADDRLDSRYFLRVQRADGLSRLPGGLEMTLDGGERLRVDVLRADVLRLKISREGRFDEQPTCVRELLRNKSLGLRPVGFLLRPGRENRADGPPGP